MGSQEILAYADGQPISLQKKGERTRDRSRERYDRLEDRYDLNKMLNKDGRWLADLKHDEQKKAQDSEEEWETTASASSRKKKEGKGKKDKRENRMSDDFSDEDSPV